MAVSESWPKHYENISYSEESSLNTLDICIPRPPAPKDRDLFWIIYIHGGAWRDPEIDATSFARIQERLLESRISDQIAGCASLNYRLSPYPSHPTNPSNPSDPARNAKHPDHINDILTAILYLQDNYHFQNRYILVGHSCGATLALQVAMKRYWGAQYESTFALELNVEPPMAIVGLEGIYDIPALLEFHKDQSVYKDFIDNAFGPTNLKTVTPTNADFDESWPDGKLVVLAHSPEDTLVEWQQVELQRKALAAQGWEEDGTRCVKVFELKGDHDEVWQTGEAARAVEEAVQVLSKQS